MTKPKKKSLSSPDETRNFENGKVRRRWLPQAGRVPGTQSLPNGSRTSRRARCAVLFAALLLPSAAAAALKVEAPNDAAGRAFKAEVAGLLAALKGSKGKTLKRLVAAAESAPADIVIRLVTDDPATWLHGVDRSSAHAAPDDGLPYGRARVKPTRAIVFTPAAYVDPKNVQWKSGVLVHELLHAIDLANGRFSGKDSVRERRAVFIQNMWRDEFGYPLRNDYHGKYDTHDYEDAKAHGRLEEVAERIFTGSDFPSPGSR